MMKQCSINQICGASSKTKQRLDFILPKIKNVQLLKQKCCSRLTKKHDGVWVEKKYEQLKNQEDEHSTECYKQRHHFLHFSD